MANSSLQVHQNVDGIELLFRDDSSTEAFRCQVEVGGSELRQLADDIDRVLGRACCHGGGNRADSEDLTRLARQLTDRLVPGELHNRLSLTEGRSLKLVVDRAFAYLPWELLLIEDQFLCLRGGIGRVGPKSFIDTLDAPLEPAELPFKIALVANPEFNLPVATREADSLRRLFANQQAVRRPRIWTHNVPRTALLEALESCNWLHFAGHAQTENGLTCWRLGDGPFGVDGINNANLSSWPQFVFAHACASAQKNVVDACADRTVESMAEAFLSAGVQHFLGTIAPVLDEDCLKFAEDFYRLVLEGQPTGIAVQFARQRLVDRCGAHNLLWACYILYGNPDVALLPSSENDVFTETRDQAADSPASDREAREITFPTKCETCGKTIKTRHGVGRHGQDGIICRACARGVPRVAAEPSQTISKSKQRTKVSVAKSEPLLSVTRDGIDSDAVSVDKRTLAEEARRRELNFVGRFAQAAERFRKLIDPATGQRHSVKLALVESGKAASKKTDVKFREPDQSLDQQPQSEFRTYELRGFQPFHEFSGRLNITLRVFCRKSQFSETGGEPAPVTDSELMALLAQEREARPRVPHLLVLASVTGWSAEGREYASGTVGTAFYDPQRAVVLFDLNDHSVVFRRDDLRLMPLAPLFDLEDDSEKVARIVRHVRSLLPLETSLGANQVASDLAVPNDLIKMAFQILTQDEDLELDEMDEFGMVLYQRQP